MQKQGGNFLLQALLALTLVFAFMPFFATKISSRDVAAQMYGASEQIETAYGAARIYLREEKDNLPYKKQELSKDKFVDVLENYGLPLGFIPQTKFNQNISLIIDKNEDGLYGFINVTSGNLSRVQLAELARRIGFYAKINGNNIEVDIPLDTIYSDVVSKKETDENNESKEDEKLSYKMREAQIKKYPYNLILGQKEVDSDTVSYRLHGEEKTTTVDRKEFIKMIKDEIKNKGIEK